MASGKQIVALLRSYVDGDEKEFFSVAMQVAAHEARQGHATLARELRDLVDAAKQRSAAIERPQSPLAIAQPKGELASLLSVEYCDVRLSELVLPEELASRLGRVLLEQRQQERLRAHGLRPRRKLLLVGPPGSGKTMTAAALAGELKLPLFTTKFEGVLTRFMGETAAKLKIIFDAMETTPGVYFFDEFDAIGARRSAANDVGEIRRVLNSFLQFLEKDESQGLLVAATNHPEMLDRALFRRFDDVLEYAIPNPDIARRILENNLTGFNTTSVEWAEIIAQAEGLSQSDLTRAANEAAKLAVLGRRKQVTHEYLMRSIMERRIASRELGGDARNSTR
jgi:SpoVK/Ycf46/Vps4 family AAA+-type ATPase